MRRILLQLDTSEPASAFDGIIAYDGGADVVLRYGGVRSHAVRDLVHGAIFTRRPKDLHHTAIFIGGRQLADGERVLAAVHDAFFGRMRVSVMLDSNGCNTTAAAAVGTIEHAVGSLDGRRAVVLGGFGPVGQRVCGLLVRAGASVVATSRNEAPEDRLDALRSRFGPRVEGAIVHDRASADAALDGAAVIVNCGAAGVAMLTEDQWAGRPGVLAVADLNAVPPAGVAGIEAGDHGIERHGVRVFGALGIGGTKVALHRACIGRLFERNDLVLDVESMADEARALVSGQ